MADPVAALNLDPTQPVDDLEDYLQVSATQTKDDNPNIVGRLLPMRPEFFPFELLKTETIFGRLTNPSVDFGLETPALSTHPKFATISAVHFRISLKDNPLPVGRLFFIEDLSSNGTSVNGKRLTKNLPFHLKSNDEISLSTFTKAFIFMESSVSIDNDFPPAMREKFVAAKTLGKGNFGEVRLLFERADYTRRVAVKVLKKDVLLSTVASPRGASSMTRIQTEIEILKKLDHPFIVRIDDWFETPEQAFLILEFVGGGTLLDRVEAKSSVTSRPMSERLVKFYSLQILRAIKYLHDCRVTHRDLKLENVLLTSEEEETQIKLADFGLAKAGNTSQLTSHCGTLPYLAPEVHLAQMCGGYYTKKVDMWAMGVLMYTCLAGRFPFNPNDQKVLRESIVTAQYDFNVPALTPVSLTAKNLIRNLLTLSPDIRFSAQQALGHEFFTQDEVIVQKVNLLMNSGPEGLTSSQERYSTKKLLGEIQNSPMDIAD